MLVYQQPLRYAEDCQWASIRELKGVDEASVADTTTPSAIDLIDRILTHSPGPALGPGHAARLTAFDRDRILAAVLKQTFGSKISATTPCDRCGEKFDLDIDIDNLIGGLDDLMDLDNREPGMSEFLTDGGVRFRLPSGEDECSVIGVSEEEAYAAIIARCILDPDGVSQASSVEHLMGRAAPTLDVDLDATCPECGDTSEIRFDVQHYLLSSIMQGRKALLRDVHTISMSYGWTLTEILNLDRSERREYASLISSYGDSGRGV